MNHTPEPWLFADDLLVSNNEDFATLLALPNDSARIIQCVNACAGLEDPEVFMQETKDHITSLEDEISQLREANLELTKILNNIARK